MSVHTNDLHRQKKIVENCHPQIENSIYFVEKIF